MKRIADWLREPVGGSLVMRDTRLDVVLSIVGGLIFMVLFWLLLS